MKHELETDFIFKDAKLVQRILTDLIPSQEEFGFFENVLMALNSLEEIAEKLQDLLCENSKQLI